LNKGFLLLFFKKDASSFTSTYFGKVLGSFCSQNEDIRPWLAKIAQ